jgi:hypothetical protein
MHRTGVGLVILAFAGMAQAQFPPGMPPGGYMGPGGIPRPTTSPYLNLLGRGNPAVNYFGIVRPQQQLQGLISGMISGVSGTGASEDLADPELRRGTGHVVTFDNLSHYYFNNPGVPSQQRGGAAGFTGMAGAGRGIVSGMGGPGPMMSGGAMGRGMGMSGAPLGGNRGFGRIR